MTAQRWTPGPWSEHGKGGCECGQIFGPDEDVVIAIVQGPMHLGPDSPDCVPHREAQQANAALITAAPELYEALQSLIAIQDRMGRYPRDGGGVFPADYGIARGKAHAALAKARGERP